VAPSEHHQASAAKFLAADAVAAVVVEVSKKFPVISVVGASVELASIGATVYDLVQAAVAKDREQEEKNNRNNVNGKHKPCADEIAGTETSEEDGIVLIKCKLL
jgi:hypothetical protein